MVFSLKTADKCNLLGKKLYFLLILEYIEAVLGNH